MYNIKVSSSNNYVDKTSLKSLVASPSYVIISELRTFIPDNVFIKYLVTMVESTTSLSQPLVYSIIII